jgi:nucleoside-diphosphate-sugar epimerase
MNKKVLVLGGTGAMGTYLVPKLVEDGYTVDVVSLDDKTSDNPRLRYIKANAKDRAVLDELLSRHYDGIVDFMIYPTGEIPVYLPLMLQNTEHYIYLSSYRVFADEEHPVVESSPRLLDASKDEEFVRSDDYGIYKARGEDFLRQSRFRNWTILRPAITYSHKRCQLITLERFHLLPYIRSGKPVPLFDKALTVHGTMSWAGDVAEMQRRILFNERAICEDFNVTTSEHHSWGEIAEYYKDLFGLNYQAVDEETYFLARAGYNETNRQALRWQLWYDRMFNRVMDNSKVLNVTGLKQSQLMPLYEGLKLERKTILEED